MENTDANIPNSCVFCDIVAAKAPAYRVAENGLAFAILDINPFTPGHCLVISKRHVTWWHDMTEEETASVFSLARTVASRMKKVFQPDLILTYARGRRIPHAHIFLVPTYNGDLLDRFFNALEKFQESPPDLARLRESTSMEQAAQRLRDAD